MKHQRNKVQEDQFKDNLDCLMKSIAEVKGRIVEEDKRLERIHGNSDIYNDPISNALLRVERAFLSNLQTASRVLSELEYQPHSIKVVPSGSVYFYYAKNYKTVRITFRATFEKIGYSIYSGKRLIETSSFDKYEIADWINSKNN